MTTRPAIIVNAIPLTQVQTGIGRYLRCLYTEILRNHQDRFQISFFDGKRLRPELPRTSSPEYWSLLARCFWKLPPQAALNVRRVLQYRREKTFHKLSKGFDLYHEAAFFPFQSPPDLKTLFTVHDLSLLRHPEYHPKERVCFNRAYFETRCALVDHFLCVSAFTKTELQDLLSIPEDRISLTTLAPDPSAFYPRSTDRIHRFKKRYALPDSYFCSVGSGDPRKNTRLIPEALQQAGLNIPCVCTGWSGWKKSSQDPLMIHLGYLQDEELACLYSGSLGLIFPSRYEGFGLPVLEAMACGCPVVTTRMASLPEVAGEAALYINDPTDHGGLAFLLHELASSPEKRRAVKERGLARAARFSWKHTARMTGQAFQRMLDHE
ncbi:MAG: glycosyltransferase family 4 protein [Desulfohalobiaceae bacterium]|nr:glycosyltransferase family 4 protein [Desulfohalobiaceae bacterium]